MRTMSAPAAISWAAYTGELPLRGTKLFFLGETVSPFVFTALALGELIADKLPATGSRRAPSQFSARLVSGALCGAAIAAPQRRLIEGALAGAAGAAIGTLAGSALRSALAHTLEADWPAALIEDSIAITAAALIARPPTSISRRRQRLNAP